MILVRWIHGHFRWRIIMLIISMYSASYSTKIFEYSLSINLYIFKKHKNKNKNIYCVLNDCYENKWMKLCCINPVKNICLWFYSVFNFKKTINIRFDSRIGLNWISACWFKFIYFLLQFMLFCVVSELFYCVWKQDKKSAAQMPISSVWSLSINSSERTEQHQLRVVWW